MQLGRVPATDHRPPRAQANQVTIESIPQLHRRGRLHLYIVIINPVVVYTLGRLKPNHTHKHTHPPTHLHTRTHTHTPHTHIHRKQHLLIVIKWSRPHPRGGKDAKATRTAGARGTSGGSRKLSRNYGPNIVRKGMLQMHTAIQYNVHNNTMYITIQCT